MYQFYGVFVTYGLCLCIVILLLKLFWNVSKSCSGFPISYTVPYIIYCQVFRKIPKNIPFSNFVLNLLVDECKQHAEEGLCMLYSIRPFLFIFGEEPIKTFFNAKAALDKSFVYKILEEAIGSGLITSSGERWKKHRKMINPAFPFGMLKQKVPLFNYHASVLVKDLESLVGKPTTDHIGFIKRHYFNALSESVFGLKQNEENEAANLRYFQANNDVGEMTVYRMSYPWHYFKFMLYLMPSGRKFRNCYNEINNFSKKIILEMKNHVISNKSSATELFSDNYRKSFTYILLQHHLNDPTFTIEELQGEVTTFMVAGYDTVSNTTLWCLFMLGLHPEVQERAFNEVQSASNSDITYEESCSFTYLESVIMETLRLYPTIPVFSRQLSEDVEWGKYKAHKDTTIVFFPYLWHKNPDIYPDPEKFDPDRFSSEEPRKQWTHIPFAEGNRSCLGKKYAMIEMKIFLAHILRNFKITSLDKKEDIQLCWKVALAPAEPLRMFITPRLEKV